MSTALEHRLCQRPGCGDWTANSDGLCSRICRRMHSEALSKAGALNDGSWPIPWTTLWPRDVEHERVIWCRRYDRCLDHAAVSGWAGFSCRRCPVDEEISKAEQLAELRRILECATDLIHETELIRRRR